MCLKEGSGNVSKHGTGYALIEFSNPELGDSSGLSLVKPLQIETFDIVE
jgi:hypothetical protein